MMRISASLYHLRVPCRSGGFTLIELVVAMTITAIVIGFVAMFMTAPVDAYMTQSERAVLNGSAEVISRRMAADLRSVLPNSVRIRVAGTRAIVEMLKVDAVSFYRPGFAPSAPDRELDTTAFDQKFSAFGSLTTCLPIELPCPIEQLVIGNTGAGTTNAYAPPANGFMTPSGMNIQVTARTAANEESVTIAPPGFRFSSTDNNNRIFLLSGPVSYICNSAARSVRRYENYTAATTSPASEADAQLNVGGVKNLLLADNAASCQLSCEAGSTEPCQKMLVVEMSVDRQTPSGNEPIRIFEQFPMDNSF